MLLPYPEFQPKLRTNILRLLQHIWGYFKYNIFILSPTVGFNVAGLTDYASHAQHFGLSLEQYLQSFLLDTLPSLPISSTAASLEKPPANKYCFNYVLGFALVC
jgi:hypothetical protein